MSVDFEVVCAEPSVAPRQSPENTVAPRRQLENTVRLIGDILPLVMAKYGIHRREFGPDVRQELPTPSLQVTVG